MSTLVEKLSKCCNNFLRLSGFTDLSRKIILITFWKGTDFSYLDYSKMFRKSSVNKNSLIFLVSLKYREIITVKTVSLYEKLYFFH